MKGTNIGELEEIVLLIVANLHGQAYGVSVKKEIEVRADRKITISTVHNVLQRLQDKGFLESRHGEPTGERGGRRKLYFSLTSAGTAALVKSRELRESLWKGIPEIALNQKP